MLLYPFLVGWFNLNEPGEFTASPLWLSKTVKCHKTNDTLTLFHKVFFLFRGNQDIYPFFIDYPCHLHYDSPQKGTFFVSQS